MDFILPPTAEATFKLCKVEFIYGRTFDSLEQLKLELADYVTELSPDILLYCIHHCEIG